MREGGTSRVWEGGREGGMDGWRERRVCEGGKIGRGRKNLSSKYA